MIGVCELALNYREQLNIILLFWFPGRRLRNSWRFVSFKKMIQRTLKSSVVRMQSHDVNELISNSEYWLSKDWAHVTQILASQLPICNRKKNAWTLIAIQNMRFFLYNSFRRQYDDWWRLVQMRRWAEVTVILIPNSNATPICHYSLVGYINSTRSRT